MNLEYQIHHVKGRVEASAEMHWYGQDGYYRVNVFGFGRSEERAKEAALAMAIRARSELQIATIDECSRRVPETTTESAHERTNDRAQCPEGTA